MEINICEVLTAAGEKLSLARTEKRNKWAIGIWTTNVYSVYKLNEQGEQGVWNDHTVQQDPERGVDPRLCSLRTIKDTTSPAVLHVM